jgi:hypothetical protein
MLGLAGCGPAFSGNRREGSTIGCEVSHVAGESLSALDGRIHSAKVG